MKKTNRRDQRDAQLRSSLREVRLQALLFGGAAAAPGSAALNTSYAVSKEIVKLPPYTGE